MSVQSYLGRPSRDGSPDGLYDGVVAGRRQGGGKRAFEAALDRLEDALEREDTSAAREQLAVARKAAGRRDAVVDYYEASIVWAEAGPSEAVAVFERSLQGDPEFADAHYGLAAAYEALGREGDMIRHFLRVLELDAADDRRAGLGSKIEQRRVHRVAAELLDRLPERFSTRLHNVPVVVEARPHRSLVEDGFDPRSLGLFEGEPDGTGDLEPVMPRRIVLYLNNLVASFPDPDDLDEQVEITVLHEVGHFFGLDEDGVAELGLA